MPRVLFDTLRAAALATVVGMIFLPLPYVRTTEVATLLQRLRAREDLIVPAWVAIGTLLLMWSSRQRGRSLFSSGVRAVVLLAITALLLARRFPALGYDARQELLASTVVDVAALVYLGAAILGFLVANRDRNPR